MAFTVDSKIKDILKSPTARAAIDGVAPGILNDPLVFLIRGKTVREACGMLPQFMPIILKKIDAALATIDRPAQGAAFNFDEVIDRAGTNSMKYDAGLQTPGLPKDHLSLWVADMDFACPQPILDAMQARMNQRILGYSLISDPDYYKAVAGWMARRHGWTVDPQAICFCSGVVEAIGLCINLYTAPDAGVIFHTPCYTPFDHTTKAHGRNPVYSPLTNTNGRFSIDFDHLESVCADPTNTMLLLCNPHNPTGRVFTEQELRRIADIAIAHNLWIVSDEIHCDLIRPGHTHIPLAKLFPDYPRLITCTSPSKTFNIAGLHIANILFNDLREAEAWRTQHRSGLPNPLSIAACMAAYTDCDDWVNAVNAYISETFAWTIDAIGAQLPNARVTTAEGTYLLWVDVRGYGLSDAALRERCTAAGLLLEYADDFVANSEGFVRINLASPRARIQEAVKRLAQCFQTL